MSGGAWPGPLPRPPAMPRPPVWGSDRRGWIGSGPPRTWGCRGEAPTPPGKRRLSTAQGHLVLSLKDQGPLPAGCGGGKGRQLTWVRGLELPRR